MRALLLSLLILPLAACLSAPALPPEGTPYAVSLIPGDNLYPQRETRIYATDTAAVLEPAHPANDMRETRSVTPLRPGTWAELLRLNALPHRPVPPPPALPACCHADATPVYHFVHHPGPLARDAFEGALEWARNP
ncbi:hypothetical protein [Vannielia litorea]|uniref:Uncharacterized protein n=1 Tax=Vannielia litorea TaxID=1217970 RepID=A0A1N6H2Z2_9RHOB|nr:hypothetical protein [Vannielia litorea]SIO14072.1 hypothetical protein SAMN05444002_3022 [Vannielia litorea]